MPYQIIVNTYYVNTGHVNLTFRSEFTNQTYGGNYHPFEASGSGAFREDALLINPHTSHVIEVSEQEFFNALEYAQYMEAGRGTYAPGYNLTQFNCVDFGIRGHSPYSAQLTGECPPF